MGNGQGLGPGGSGLGAVSSGEFTTPNGGVKPPLHEIEVLNQAAMVGVKSGRRCKGAVREPPLLPAGEEYH